MHQHVEGSVIRSSWNLFITLILLLLVGCGRGNSFQYPALSKVSGELKINGEPAPGAMLIFVTSSANGGIDARGTRPHAVVDADGKFEVTSYVEGDGIPVGDYQVAIIWEDVPNSSSAWDQLGGKYARAEQTGIQISVQEGKNTIEPISLEKVRILNRPSKQAPQSNDGID